MPEISEIIQQIKDLDLSGYPYFQIQELIRSLGTTSFFVFTLHKGKIITRAREGGNYLNKNEISYPPVEKCKDCQRASIPNKTMFYGTIVQEKQPLKETRMLAASESSSLLRNGIDSVGFKKITFGRWSVIKDINLIVIVDEHNFNEVSNNALLTELKNTFDSIPGTEEQKEKYKLILSYFADEFSKEGIQKDYEYLVSALFSEIITTELGYDGVMYPSVQLGGQLGFNVAIKPEIVDNNLILDIVAESTIYKKKDKSLLLVDKISDMTKWQYVDSSQVTPEIICEELEINSINELNKTVQTPSP
jgi:hypothetical protein